MTYIGAAIGAIWGGYLAYKRKGSKLDILHYVVVFAIAFALLAAILNVIYLRMI